MYEVWSPRKGLRVDYSHIQEGRVYMYITHYQQAGGPDHPETLREYLLKLCDFFPSVVKTLIALSDPENIIRTDLYDFRPIPRWTDGSVALLGDAAHATTPNLGQGACQALEDDWVLSRELSSADDVPGALKLYEYRRKAKAAYITRLSWQFAQATNTSGLLKSVVITLMRLTPDWVNERIYDKILWIIETRRVVSFRKARKAMPSMQSGIFIFGTWGLG